jgi:hypothetical protein
MPTLSMVPFRFLFIIEIKMCGPLGMGRLGCQPFKVSETFSTPGCLKALFTQGTILVNNGGVQLELANFCVDVGEFLIKVIVVEEFSCNTPVIKFVGEFNHGEKLQVWPIENGVEPLGKQSG